MIGRKLSQFEITARLGEGAMGEVYRATDTRLGREVAIKVLPEAFTSDEERLARFEREARALAALSHPNIAAIYEVGEEEGAHFLVMELADGETLAERIDRGPIPLDQTIGIALQIADGLEAAHERGIVHRDLKPANVKVTPEGQVKILDFGLAKALDAHSTGGAGEHPTFSPTMTARETGAGVLLGTAAYMSPEQARGQSVDRRADIWAFGVVLAEMLTGECPFAGETVSDTLAAVLTREIEPTGLPEEAPHHVRWLLTRCLERDSRLRLRDIGEARVVLASGTSPEAVPHRAGPALTGRRRSVAAAVGLATVVGLVGLWLGARLSPVPPAALRKTDLVIPNQLPFFQSPPIISPDGSAVLFDSPSGLKVRRLDGVESKLLPGTAGALFSTWAPNSREIAFATPGHLWRATLEGEAPVPLATLPEDLAGGGGMAWTQDDRILLAGSAKTGLLEVSARGGNPTETARLDPETERDFHEISLLPEGRGILLSVHPQGEVPNRIDVLSGGVRKTVLSVGADWIEQPVYSPPGYILFSKGIAAAPGLWAVPFSLDRLEATGEPFLVSPDGSAPSVSNEGVLSHIRGRRVVLRNVLQLDRDGRIVRELTRPVPGARHPALSRDGSRLVASIVDSQTYDLMLFDPASRTGSRLTSGPGVDSMPAWSPDGRTIAYERSDSDRIAIVPVDRPGESLDLAGGMAPSWMPDGESLLFQRLGEGASWDVWRFELETKTETPLLAGRANERWPVASPDGRWLAYTSDDVGQETLFARELPRGEPVQVTDRAATDPRWSPTGELLFRSGPEIWVTRRLSGERSTFEEPRLVLSLADEGLAWEQGSYAPTANGGLVVLRNVSREDDAVLTLVENWFLEFQRDRR